MNTEDLKGMYGMDITEKIEAQLVKELSDSIDKAIINNIFNSWPPIEERRVNSIDKIFKIKSSE